MSNESALEELLAESELGVSVAPLVEAARSLARALDDPSGCSKCGAASQNAALWKEYRATVGVLLEVVDGADDERSATVHRLRTPLRHAEES